MQITELTVTLLYTEPKVMRKIEVQLSMTLEDLHTTLQAAFGWEDAHLYQFCIGEPYQMDAKRWVSPAFVDSSEDLPANKTTLAEALESTGKTGLTYLYDFGDDWEHKIKASTPKDADLEQTYPELTNIQNTCPPEDIGGPPGFEMFKEAMADLKHPEHEEMKNWFGEKYNASKPNEKKLKANLDKIAKKLNR